MDDPRDLQRRLQHLGEHPVDPTVQAAHLAGMHTIRARGAMGHKLRLAAVFLAGLLVGGSGLAAAGALPDPAQHAAHRVLGEVGVNVPDPERYHGPECGTEVKRNHGAYVRDDKALARTGCGKPAGKGAEPDSDGTEVGEREPEGCQGPPPWAGSNKSSMTKEEKVEARTERTADCGADVSEADESESEDAEGADDLGSTDAPAKSPTTEATTTTTAVPDTTTTEAPTTTSTSPTAP